MDKNLFKPRKIGEREILLQERRLSIENRLLELDVNEFEIEFRKSAGFKNENITKRIFSRKELVGILEKFDTNFEDLQKDMIRSYIMLVHLTESLE